MTGLPPSPSADLLSAAVLKLAGLHARMDSLEQHVNSRLDERDRVVLAVADTIDRLTARMDSYEEARTASGDGSDEVDYPVGQLAEGPEAQEDAELFEQEPTLKTGPEPEYRHTPPPEYQELPALEG